MSEESDYQSNEGDQELNLSDEFEDDGDEQESGDSQDQEDVQKKLDEEEKLVK